MSQTALKINNVVAALSKSKRFEKCFKDIKLLFVGDGKCTAELKIAEEHTNPLGGLHGGLSATLIDSVSTWGLFTHEKASGINSVSVNINVSYLSGAKEGDDILIEAETLKVGKSLAFCEVLIKNKTNGNVLVKGEHTKYLMR